MQGPPQSAHPFAPRGDAIGPPAPQIAAPPPDNAPDCASRLKELGATFSRADTPKSAAAECVIDQPVRLEAIAVRMAGASGTVRLTGSPLLACEMAIAVTEWVQGSIAPLARGHFGEPLIELGVGGGFECRQRNHQTGAPRSEHSYGRALDLLSFHMASRTITVQKAAPSDVKPFLDAVWASGCGQFSTALGPEADALHATHIHVDMQPRRTPTSKFCQ